MNLAHRGASAYSPENTLAAFYKGVELGANGIETDLQKTKDGVIFLFHDDRLDNKTDVRGSATQYTWAELKEADAGSWFSTRYQGERLVSLSEFLYYFGRKELIFAIELKAPFIAEETKEVIKLIDEYGVRDKVTITSFIFENLVATREVDKNIKTGYLLRERIGQSNIERVKSIGAVQICPSASLLSPGDVVLAKESGLEVRAWGIKNTELMQHALTCGVDGMTIDFPDKLPK